MLEVIFSIFVLCFAIIGLIDVFKIIYTSFFSVRNDYGNAIFLIPAYGHNEEIEMILRNAMANIKWINGSKNRKVVCLDLGMDDETRQICEIISEENDLVELYSLEEFNEIVKKSFT